MARHFAIIPACGQSTRMGRPKLLLPLEGKPLVCHALAAWRASSVASITAVVRRDDTELAAALAESGADVVLPSLPPADMKASVQAALSHITSRHAPSVDDSFLVAPADIPRLSPAIVDALISRHDEQPGSILVPTLAGRRGHPVLFPWLLSEHVFRLQEDEGLNSLASRFPPVEVPCDGLVPAGSRPFADIDTPEQYQALGGEYRDE